MLETAYTMVKMMVLTYRSFGYTFKEIRDIVSQLIDDMEKNEDKLKQE